jgi:NAD(P)-dependent dehydrogenase (short-subunit alcohol dehydrogenase family)
MSKENKKMRLAGKVALITGGGAGIGRAAVGLFAREGAKVVLAEYDAETGAAAAAEVRAQGGEVVFIQSDVSQPEQVERAVALAVSEFGGLDIIYNNVGGSTLQDGPVTTAPFVEFQKKINVDLFGTWLGCKYAIPEMVKRGGGAIVNASSICGLRGTTGRDAYTAAKGAIGALTRSMAVEFAPHNIRVNAVAPGSTMTERVAERRRKNPSRLTGSDRHLLGFNDPIDVAYAVLFLASDESRRITGQILAVDSGFTIT